MSKVDLYEVMLREHGKVPAGWLAFYWNCAREEVPEGFIKVTGGVPVGVYTRGPRKGRVKWGQRGKDKTESTHFVSDKEMDAFCEEWERRTGSCYACMGSRKTASGWSKDDGTSYVPCKRCKDREAVSACKGE